MALINENYLRLPQNYLFKEIARKINAYKAMHPNADIIHLDYGDSKDIAKGSVAKILHSTIDDMVAEGGSGQSDTLELSKSIVSNILKEEYESRGVRLTAEEIFLSNNSMNLFYEIFDVTSADNVMGFLDPSYPAHIYTTVMSGRAGYKKKDGRWSNLIYVPCNWENGFAPEIPNEHADVLYLNLPHNPTGTVFDADELKKWVKYAIANNSLIIFDASHAHYIQDNRIPHSIYEIKGAKKVAVEFRSFSKTTGFTGTNFAFLVIPKDVNLSALNGELISFNKIWQRRHISQFSGIPYLTLKSAYAMYSDEGMVDRKKLVDYYMENARIIRTELKKLGMKVNGGENSPYVWVKTPNNIGSWNFFEQMMYETNVICSPGLGFCPGGEGSVRFTGFGNAEKTKEAMERLSKWI